MGKVNYDDLASEVITSSATYPVWVGWSIIDKIGERVKTVYDAKVAYVVADEGVNSHARRVQVSMESAGIPTYLFFVPSGENHKNLDTVKHIYSWLANHKAARNQLLYSGEVVLLGSVVKTQWLSPGDNALIEVDGLGTVSARFLN